LVLLYEFSGMTGDVKTKLCNHSETKNEPSSFYMTVLSRPVGTRTAWYQTEWTQSNSWYSSQVL